MTLFAVALSAISVVAGVRCFDVTSADGGCVTSQQVAFVGTYGEVHGAFVANDFPKGAGIVVGATWGGDLGSPFYRFRNDRLRVALRLTIDCGLTIHQTVPREQVDFDVITFAAGPQLWARISPSAFFVARAGAGGSFFVFDFFFRDTLRFSPTVDASLGFAFDLQ